MGFPRVPERVAAQEWEVESGSGNDDPEAVALPERPLYAVLVGFPCAELLAEREERRDAADECERDQEAPRKLRQHPAGLGATQHRAEKNEARDERSEGPCDLAQS